MNNNEQRVLYHAYPSRKGGHNVMKRVLWCLFATSLYLATLTGVHARYAISYSTIFPLTENPISEGGHWINGGSVGLDWSNVRTAPGLAYGTQPGTTGYNDSIAILSGDFNPNQRVRAIVHGVNQPGDGVYTEVEILLHFRISAHVARGYEVCMRVSKSAYAYLSIVRWNGALGDFTFVLPSQIGSGFGVADGDVVEAAITVAGGTNTITVWYNGVQKAQVKDSTWLDGSPGMGFYNQYGGGSINGDFGFSSFSASDVSTDTIAPSVSITSPTSGSTYSTSNNTISIGGSASDNVGVTQVAWANSRGGSGTATGTTSWTVSGITLQDGSNILTVTAQDAANNSGTAILTVTYTSPDTSPPLISNISTDSVTATTATISWTTDEASDSQIEFGTTAAYGNSSPLSTIMVTFHQVILSGLTPGTSYHFRVRSMDPTGNLAVSADFTLNMAASCSYTLLPSSVSIISAAANGSLAVQATAGCAWTSSSNAGWITITSGNNGNGSGIVGYSVAFNATSVPRTGNIAISNQTFTINQAGTTYDINGDSAVNVLDLQTLVNVILGVSSSKDRCDLNGDGAVNVIDLQLLINAILGIV